MAAAAKAGSFIFRGLQSGTFYQKGMLNEDVLQVLARWDNGGGIPATTKGADFCVFPEDVALVDINTITGITDTAQLRILADYNPTPYTIKWESYLATNTTRPPIYIGFKKGTRVSAMSTA